MTKLMFALWGDLGGLHSPEVHGRLEAAGGIRLQVNVADEHVERAMRISTFEPGIDGFASVWTATETVGADIAAALLEVADRVVRVGGRGAQADRSRRRNGTALGSTR